MIQRKEEKIKRYGIKKQLSEEIGMKGGNKMGCRDMSE
jgi:hypothetical protein